MGTLAESLHVGSICPYRPVETELYVVVIRVFQEAPETKRYLGIRDKDVQDPIGVRLSPHLSETDVPGERDSFVLRVPGSTPVSAAEGWLSPEAELRDAPFTPETVLNELCDLSITDSRRRELVIQAELLRFDESQKSELLSVLLNFINACRDSNELDDLIAVGSAIRKYVANMETANIGSVATLLEAGHAGTPPLGLKLELVKMIFRSFEASPPPKPDPEPQLAERVFEIARAYLNPNVLPDGKNATVAMLAVQALVAMLSKRASEALVTVNKLPQPHRWFREQLRRRLINLRERWAGNPAAVQNLSKLMVSVVED